MTAQADDLNATVVEAKAQLRRALPRLEEIFAALSTELDIEIAEIVERSQRGEPVIPEIAYTDIVSDAVPAERADDIRRRGCAIVRGVFARTLAVEWNAELGDYVARNNYLERSESRAGLDRYFSTLSPARPQIFGIYWSKPQIAARQSSELAATRIWLNGLWRQADGNAVFRAERLCTYADRIRRRDPGDSTLGLSAHMDGGSVERWLDPAFQRVYRHIFSGDFERFDPFAADHRTEVREIPSPAVCRMFRTYQGWTALTQQGPGDGTLRLLPIARGIAYLLLRPLLEDVPPESLCGAAPGRALGAGERWHAPLLRGFVSIPRVFPGDTVWWHPDLLHAVEDVHRGSGASNVMYISSAPDCPKNRAYLELQKPAFTTGRSSPDFAAEDYEVAFSGRATHADLSALGRQQMGFEPRVG